MNNNKDIIAIVIILRKVTKIVKIYPFVYAMLYAFCMVGYMIGSEQLSCLLDQLFYTSPISILFALLLSRSLKLCKWHKLECILPMIPLIHLAIGSYIIPLNSVSAIINVATVITLCLASLINAYFVFIHKPNIK
jgi:hypothetical protein